MENLRKIVENAREIGVNNFKKFAKFTNTDQGKKMIEFWVIHQSERVVDNWGRTEDVDSFVGLDDVGWLRYTQVCQSGAGKFKIISENTCHLSDDEIIQELSNSSLKYDKFMKRFEFLQNNI